MAYIKEEVSLTNGEYFEPNINFTLENKMKIEKIEVSENIGFDENILTKHIKIEDNLDNKNICTSACIKLTNASRDYFIKSITGKPLNQKAIRRSARIKLLQKRKSASFLQKFRIKKMQKIDIHKLNFQNHPENGYWYFCTSYFCD